MISALPFGKFGDKESGQLPPSRLLRQLQFTPSFEEHSFRNVCCVKSAVLTQSPDGLSIVLAYCVSRIVHNIVQERIPRISKDGSQCFAGTFLSYAWGARFLWDFRMSTCLHVVSFNVSRDLHNMSARQWYQEKCQVLRDFRACSGGQNTVSRCSSSTRHSWSDRETCQF